jgi:hypothetical protein
VKCSECNQPLVAKGSDAYAPCANPDCSKCPKCAKHNEPIKSNNKCATCITEEREAIASELRTKVGNALTALKGNPVGSLNGVHRKLDCPGNKPAAGQYPTVTVAGKPYPYIALAGDDRLKKISVDFGDENRSMTLGIGGDGSAPACFYLPWKEDAICTMTLDQSAEWFITARMNGCCTMIGGTRKAPKVVHANLNDQLPVVKHGDSFEKTRTDQLLAYTQAYAATRAALVTKGLFADDTVQMFDPAFYMGQQRGGRGVVFGLKDGQNDWTFYYQLDLSLRVPWRWFGQKGWEWGFHGDWVKAWDKKDVIAQANELWPVRRDP